jgi:hypothetical protein
MGFEEKSLEGSGTEAVDKENSAATGAVCPEVRRVLPSVELHRRLWLIYSMAFEAAERGENTPGE